MTRATCISHIRPRSLCWGDAKLTVISLIAAVKDRLGGKRLNRSPATELAVEREAWLGRWHAKLSSSETPMTPYRVMSEFIRVVDPAEAIVTHDSGSPRDQLLPFYRATRPRGYLGWGKSHQFGTGLGLIIGAKVAAPEKFCVNFMGDAAFGMTGLDLETAVRAGIPSLTIVLNNSTMAIEIPHMKLSHKNTKRGISAADMPISPRIWMPGLNGSPIQATSPTRSCAPDGRPRTDKPLCWNL
jgi:acetolactate synthase-1/2/3 large subunit